MSDSPESQRKSAGRGKRKRRTPEEARALILAAAKEALLELGPDAISLVEVARRASVSHGLVSHYFGSIDNLLERAFADHIDELRSQMLARLPHLVDAGPGAVLEEMLERGRDPLYGKLIAWALLSGRVAAADFAPAAVRGSARLADALEAIHRQRGGAEVERDVLETIMVLTVCATIGYSLAGATLWRSFDREPSAERDQRFRDTVARMISGELGIE
jgi:AcrR family transcriptional regulator